MASVIEFRPRERSRGEPDDLDRLRKDNRRLAVTVGAFSGFLAGRGLLEEAWQYVNQIHDIEDGPRAD